MRGKRDEDREDAGGKRQDDQSDGVRHAHIQSNLERIGSVDVASWAAPLDHKTGGWGSDAAGPRSDRYKVHLRSHDRRSLYRRAGFLHRDGMNIRHFDAPRLTMLDGGR